MTERRKAYALITYGNRLLVFEHTDAPEAGIQIPGGTVEPHEDPQEAVMREAEEETGLTALRLVRFLGEQRIEFGNADAPHSHHRFYYHLVCDTPAPDRWQHVERYPSNMPEGTEIPFTLYWVDVDACPPLIADFGAGVNLLIESRTKGEPHAS